MNLVGFISTAVLSLTLIAAAPAFAQEQHEQQEEQKAKPAQEEKKAQPEKSVKQEEKPTAQSEMKAKQGEKSAPQQDKNTKNTKNEEKKAQPEKNTKQAEKSAQPQHNAQQANSGQQAQSAGRKGGGRIPEDRFKANFGRQHTFRVTQADYSNHRFQYGGYWFGFADPWPSNWLYTQDVYVVEINGVYYLCNATYPGVNLTLNFTL